MKRVSEKALRFTIAPAFTGCGGDPLRSINQKYTYKFKLEPRVRKTIRQKLFTKLAEILSFQQSYHFVIRTDLDYLYQIDEFLNSPTIRLIFKEHLK